MIKLRTNSLLAKKTALAVLLMVGFASNAFAQLSITPPFEVSACNTDSVVVSFKNSLGTSATVGDTATIKVVLPGAGLIKYDSGSLRVYNYEAATASGYSDTVEIKFPLPPVGRTLNMAFDVNSECDVPSLSAVSLPVINGEISYPTGYAVTSESVTTNEFNCVAAQLVLQVSSTYTNLSIPKFRTAWRIVPILNGGYGSIDEFYIVDTTDSEVVFIAGTQRIYEGESSSVYQSITYTEQAISGNRIVRTYKVTSDLLGSDGVLTPNETVRLYQRIRLDTCAQFNSSITTYFKCNENAPICGSPDYLQASVLAHGGNPNIQLTTINVDTADGCPSKHIELVYHNNGTVYSGTNDLSNANNLKLRFEFKNQTITNLLLNNQTVTYTESDGIVEIDLAQFNSAFGPLTSFEMDGIYNDLPVGDSLFLEFDYTTNCEEACGADAFSQLMNRSTYEDLCGFGETKGQMAYEFGFRQLSPVSNEPPVNYSCQGDGTYDTLSHKWAMDFEAINYKLDGVTGELVIRFAKNMNFDASSVKLNNVALTPTVYDDSAVVSLTNAQVVAFLNAGRDSLEYATELICDTLLYRSGATGLQDNFSFILNLDGNGSCSPGCELDLTCNAVTAYGYEPCCGTGCIYDQDSFVVGRTQNGSTDLGQTGDTIASNQNLWMQDTIVITDQYSTRANGYGTRTDSRFIYHPYYYYDQTDLSMQYEPPFLFVGATIRVNGGDELPWTIKDRQGWSDYAHDYDNYANTTYDHFAINCVGAPNNTTCFGNEYTTGIQSGGGQSDWPLGPNFGYRVWGIDTTFHRFNNQTNVNQAIERAGLVVDYFKAGNTYDFEMKYIPNPDFNWETTGNITFSSNLTTYTKQTTNNIGSCNTIIDNITIIDPKLYIDNPYATYNNACGLSVNHDFEFEGFNGDYFPNEYRFPFRIDSVVMDIPTEYGIVSGSDSFYSHSDGVGTWNQPGAGTFSRSAANGHVLWTGNLADGYFPKTDDAAGYQMPIRLNYDLQKLGTAADSSYTIPVTFYGKDDYGNVKIYTDTIKVTEDNPVIVITPISPVVTAADGGDCEEVFMDYQVCNNSIYTAKNLFLAAESFNGTTINSISDLGTVSFNPIVSGTDTAYGVNKLFQPVGTLREGECRDVRVSVNIYNCSDSIRLYADYGCEYPSPRMPDYTSTTIDSGTGEFNTFSPAIQTKTQPFTTGQTYCDTVSAQIEMLNTKLPNLYNIQTEIDFPAGVEIIASTLDYQYNGGPWRAIPVAAVNRGGYVGGNYQDSALINWNQVTTAEFNDDCGLPGADENPANNVIIRYDFVFVGCMPPGAVVQYNSSAETFCGDEVTYQSVSNIITVNSEAPNPENDFAITSSAAPDLVICNELNDAQTMFDTLTIENLGGYGVASGATNGSDSIVIQLPNNGLSFTLSNISVNDAAFGTPRIYTSMSGGQVMKMAIPSGLAVNSTIDLPIQYDMTLLNFNYCGLVSPYQAAIYTYNSSGCAAKAIVCDITETERESEVIDRTVDCCEIEIGNFVWLDTDGDGVQDAGEMGLGGITVELYDDMGVLVATTTTDSNGQYSFNRTEDGMMPGEQYEVRIPTAQDTISHLSATVTGSGTGEDDNNGTSGGGGTYTTSGLFTAPDEETRIDTTIDFGFIGYSIGNTVWWDDNNDGEKGPNEEGIEGVKMYLLDDVGNVIDSTVTDANGAYVFEGLLPGDYQVAVADDNSGDLNANSQVSGTTNTTADTDDNNDGSATDPVGNTSISFRSISNTITLGGKSEPTDESDEDPNTNVPDNQSNLSIDFGFYNNITIGDYVWVDADGDGVQDTDEMGIPGVRVELYDSLGNFITFATTDANGRYEFTTENDSIVPSAKYEIRIPTAQTNITDLSPTGTGSGTGENDNNGTSGGGGSYVTSGDIYTPDRDTEIDTSFDFGFIGYSIGNTVWWDNDNDGIQDANEIGIAGVLMYLIDDAGNVIDSTTTDASGNYLFDGLLPGDYQVAVASSLTSGALDGAGVSGTTNTTADADGNNDGSATDPVGNTTATFSSISSTVTLGGKNEPTDEDDEDPNSNYPDNQSNLTVDFGFTPPITAVGNYIFHDIDSNGVNNGADTALVGVKVYLYQDLDGDGTPETLMDSVLTDANGFYVFDSLGAGNFQLVLAPDNFISTGPLSLGIPTSNGSSGDNTTDNNSEGSSSGIFTLNPNSENTGDANDDAAPNFDDDDANFSFDFGIKSSVSGGPVPVTWLSFEVAKQGEADVLLSWSTASELNNRGFEVHRSLDRGTTFEAIGFVNGQGTTSEVSNYNFVDKDAAALDVSQLCYVLNQIDYNGVSDMTDIECVSYELNSKSIVVYPNPASSLVNVEFTQVEETASVELLTVEGQILESKQVKAGEPSAFDVGSYESGVYIIRIVDGANVSSHRVIVNH